MKNKNQKLSLCRYASSMVGHMPSRLIWQNAPSTHPQETSTVASALDDLNTGITEQQGAVQRELEQHLGEPIQMDDLIENEDGALDVIGRLAETWDDTFEKLSGYIGLLFGRKIPNNQFEEAVHTPSVDKHTEEEEEERANPLGNITIKNNHEVSRRHFNRAKHAAEALDIHPEWKTYLNNASIKWGFSVSTLASFIEIESSWNPNDTPTYEDKDGKKVHAKDEAGVPIKRILTKEEQKNRGLKLYSSASGLAQVMRRDSPKYAEKRYDEFVRERGSSSGIPPKNDPELFFNAEIAIDYMAWHLKNKVNEVKRLVENSNGAFPDNYKDIEGNMKFLYMSYNNGAYGYLVLRRYQENPTSENFNKLVYFQKRDYKSRDGKKSLGLEGNVRASIGDKAAQVHKAFESFLG